MQVMSDLILKLQNNFIKEKQVTEAARNLTQFKEVKNKKWILSKHNQPLNILCTICVLYYVIGDNKLGML